MPAACFVALAVVILHKLRPHPGDEYCSKREYRVRLVKPAARCRSLQEPCNYMRGQWSEAHNTPTVHVYIDIDILT